MLMQLSPRNGQAIDLPRLARNLCSIPLHPLFGFHAGFPITRRDAGSLAVLDRLGLGDTSTTAGNMDCGSTRRFLSILHVPWRHWLRSQVESHCANRPCRR